MHEEQALKKRILDKAYEMFCQYGISKVTMGEIAAGIGVSKKTLYKYYQNKKDVLSAIHHGIIMEIDATLESLVYNTELEFPDKMKKIMNYLANQSAKLKGPLIDEMKIFYPEFWKETQEFRKKCSWERFSKLIEEGVQKCYFRNDVDKHVFVLLYTTAVHHIITPEVLSELSLSGEQVYNSILLILFHGYLTDEGRQHFTFIEANR